MSCLLLVNFCMLEQAVLSKVLHAFVQVIGRGEETSRNLNNPQARQLYKGGT